MRNSLLLIILFLSQFCLFGSHSIGVRTYYDWAGTDTLQVTRIVYYDCAAAATSSPNGGTGLSSTYGSFQGTIPQCVLPTRLTNSMAIQRYIDVTPVCAGITTSCNSVPFGSSAPIRGYLEALFTGSWDFSNTTCSQYTFSASECCRNGIITSGAAFAGISSGFSVDLGINPRNNAPRFLNPPVAYVCSGSPKTLDYSAYDPDGDSLVYRLGPCFSTTTQAGVPYSPGFSPASPLGSSWNITIDSQTGIVTLTPNPGQVEVGVLCVEVEEFRNGISLGTTRSDIQVTVLNCQANSSPEISQVTVFGGANQLSPHSLEGAVGLPISFSVQVTDPDVLDTLTSSFDTLYTGISNVSYSVSGQNPQTVTATWTPPAAGNYFLRMRSYDQSCPLPGIAYHTFSISVAPYTVIGNVTNTPCDSTNGEIDLIVAGGFGPFNYQWSSGQTTQDIQNLAPGSYTVQVIDQNMDTLQKIFFVSGIDINLNAAVFDSSCNSNNAIQLAVTGGNPPYSYQWNTGSNVDGIDSLNAQAGYSVLVTDSRGCVRHGAWWIDGPDSCINIISGTMYMDANNNCQQDPGEIPLPNVVVGLTHANVATLTDINGQYLLSTTFVGPDTLYTNPSYFIYPSCPNTNKQIVSFDSLGMRLVRDFAMGLDSVADLVALRSFSWVRPGLVTQIGLLARNDGSVSMDGTLQWKYDSIFQYQSSTPPFTRHDVANRILEWDFANLQPGQSFRVSPVLIADSTTLDSTCYSDTLTILPIPGDTTPLNNVLVYKGVVRTSFDPNDKRATPSQRLPEGWIFEEETTLNYTIRFQNTGSDTAFFVAIRDTIATDKLDISTLKMADASHPYTLRIHDNNALEFRFDHIRLPDSLSDPEGSQGFVSFTIDRLPNLPAYAKIENKASIYFDFNAPVVTNTVLRTLYTDLLAMSQDSFVVCSNDMLEVSASGGAVPYSFRWPDGYIEAGNMNGISQYNLDSSARYEVIVRDALDKEKTVSFYADISPSPNAQIHIQIFPNGDIELAGEEYHDSWLWDFGDGQNDTGRIVQHRYQRTGEYTVQLIVENSCGSDTSTQSARIIITDIDQAMFESSVYIVPNPLEFSAVLHFSNPQHQSYSLRLYDMQGKEMRSYPGTLGESFTIQKGDLMSGVYVFKLNGPNSHYGRLIVR